MDIYAVKPACNGTAATDPGARDIEVQAAISISLGVSAFLAFCVSKVAPFWYAADKMIAYRIDYAQFLRSRWKSLYAARKCHLEPHLGLPALPDSFFGWIPVLHGIDEQLVLDAGGLDAYVVCLLRISQYPFGK